MLAILYDLVMATESLLGVICGLCGSFFTQFLLRLGAATVLQDNPLFLSAVLWFQSQMQLSHPD